MRDMISVASGFQYSVNIGYDLGSDDKLKNFIPTKSALNLLEDILLSVSPLSTDRARVLIGAYGKGKSHIVLTILSMLIKRDLVLFEKLMPKIKENPRLYQLVQNYYDSEQRILPVVINGSNTSLTQAFLLSLQRTLSENDLLSAMPETNYKAATNVIRRWKKDFPEAFIKFQNSIDVPVDVFADRLENYDVAAYEVFERIYPTLTAGSIFNPFLGFDVVELYESVAKSLKSKGYTGIYVVYDEFSKFLEANIGSASVSDTKMLQDFAEKCCRSGALQLHLMLISHKEISNYIDKLPKEKTDGWRGVSERFKEIMRRYRVNDRIDTSLDVEEFGYDIALVDDCTVLSGPMIPAHVHMRPYQIDAIEAWTKQNYVGIFDMARGTMLLINRTLILFEYLWETTTKLTRLPCGHIRPFSAVRHHRRPENAPQGHRTACGFRCGYCQRPQGSGPLSCGNKAL